MKRLTAIATASLLGISTTAFAAPPQTLPPTAAASAVLKVEERLQKAQIRAEAKAAPQAKQGGKPQEAPKE